MVRCNGWRGAWAGGALALVLAAPAAWAQKNSGPLLPTAPQPVRPAPSFARPSTPAAPRTAAPPSAGGTNPDAARLAQTLPIDPAVGALVNQEPADPRATERRLGLREPRGAATDMRGRRPSSREIVDALAPR